MLPLLVVLFTLMVIFNFKPIVKLKEEQMSLLKKNTDLVNLDIFRDNSVKDEAVSDNLLNSTETLGFLNEPKSYKKNTDNAIDIEIGDLLKEDYNEDKKRNH